MNKLDLAARLARQWHRSRAKAADEVDALIYNLLKDLKRSAGRDSLPAPDAASMRRAPSKDRQ